MVHILPHDMEPKSTADLIPEKVRTFVMLEGSNLKCSSKNPSIRLSNQATIRHDGGSKKFNFHRLNLHSMIGMEHDVSSDKALSTHNTTT